MPVAAMRTRDVVIEVKCFADAYSNRFFAAVQMRQTGHKGASIEFVDLLFEETNSYHLPVRTQPFLLINGHAVSPLRLGSSSCHFFGPPAVTGVATPDIAASTSKTQAKSYFVQPMPRAAVRNSLLTAVVGRGTSSCRPRSMARTISFCIMLTSNQASSGCCRTNGPRY